MNHVRLHTWLCGCVFLAACLALVSEADAQGLITGRPRTIAVERPWAPSGVLVAAIPRSRDSDTDVERGARLQALATTLRRQLESLGGSVEVETRPATRLLIVTVLAGTLSEAEGIVLNALRTPRIPPEFLEAARDLEARKVRFQAASPRRAFERAWQEAIASTSPRPAPTGDQPVSKSWAWVTVRPEGTRQPPTPDTRTSLSTQTGSRTPVPVSNTPTATNDPETPPEIETTRTVVTQAVVTTWIGDAYPLGELEGVDAHLLAAAMGLMIESAADRTLFEHSTFISPNGTLQVWVSVDPSEADRWEAFLSATPTDIWGSSAADDPWWGPRLRTRWAQDLAPAVPGAIAAAEALLMGISESGVAELAGGLLPQDGVVGSVRRGVTSLKQRIRVRYGPGSG